MLENFENRTKQFKWDSRCDLYNYFSKNHSLDKERIDLRIDQTMIKFRPRRGQAIHTRELWQKVGLDIERELGVC